MLLLLGNTGAFYGNILRFSIFWIQLLVNVMSLLFAQTYRHITLHDNNTRLIIIALITPPRMSAIEIQKLNLDKACYRIT